MLGNRKLILDTFCEVYDLLKPWCDQDFWDFANHEIVEGAVYLVSRKEVVANPVKIREIAESGRALIVFSNPAEGSETLVFQTKRLHDLVTSKKILLLGGGDMDDSYPCLRYDSFLPKIFDYRDNIRASMQWTKIYDKTEKPYKFLFFNGRVRPHRKYLLERFEIMGLLDQSLWTNLETGVPSRSDLKLAHEGQDLIGRPRDIKLLDPQYEVDRYKNYDNLPPDQYPYSKNTLFNHEWGEVYLKPDPYVDTYFSLVTETVFSYPHSFRTEKIWKPIAMAHPWIAVANRGYYRDMRDLGFRTFNGIIDESFDLIDDNQARIERIVEVVDDLCRQDLPAFLAACKDICKYNQEHFSEMRTQVRKEFPDRFFQFINQYINE